MPAGLSLIQKRVILFPLKTEVLVSLFADWEEDNPEVLPIHTGCPCDLFSWAILFKQTSSIFIL